MENSRKMSWEKRITDNNMTKSIEVTQCENGFIISISKYGNGEDDKYVNEVKKYISETNPLQETEPKDNDEKSENLSSMKDLLSKQFGDMSFI